MNLIIILIILGLVIAFFLSLRILRGLFKAVITVFMLLIILVGVIGIIIYSDASTLKKGLEGEKKVFLDHEGEIVAGFVAGEVSTINIIGNSLVNSYNEQKISEYNEKYQDDELEADEGLIIIMNSEFMKGKELELGTETIIFDDETLENILNAKSNNELAKILSLEDAQTYNYFLDDFAYDAQDFKNKVFFSIIVEQSRETKGKFLFNGIKNKEITTSPSLISIKVINMFPTRLYEKITKSMPEE